MYFEKSRILYLDIFWSFFFDFFRNKKSLVFEKKRTKVKVFDGPTSDCDSNATGGIILTPPSTKPPLEKNPGFWKILKPRRKNSRAKRAKIFGFFLGCFSRQNGPKTVKAWKIFKTPSRTFWGIWKILKPREKKSEISSLRGGVLILSPR